MSSDTRAKTIVVDANINMRATLGRRVRQLFKSYGSQANLVTPEIAYDELRHTLPKVLEKRGIASGSGQRSDIEEYVNRLPNIVIPIADAYYVDRETEARRRLRGVDESDWPYVALALALNCPIWTEDRDFFGCSVATWTTDRVDIYFEATV